VFCSRAAIGALLAVLAVAGCGDLPRPFEGNPGATALRLAQPPPARLAVLVPTNAQLPPAANLAYANALVLALQDQDVPVVPGRPRKGDWLLAITAEVRDGTVVPMFTVRNPDGKDQGTAEGAPMDAARWSAMAGKDLDAAAAAAAPLVASLLTNIEARRRENDPNSLVNRPARVEVVDVTGAPGDGNRSLTRQMRLHLPQVGELLAPTPATADFLVQGTVRTATDEKGERIEIQWIVTTPDGNEVGRVVQLNDVAPGSLDGLWGDVALVVTQEAAGGVRDVILNQTGKRATAAATGNDPRPRGP
jgi:hypothetical protein